MLALAYTAVVAVLWFLVMTGGSVKVAAVATVGPPVAYFAVAQPTFFLAMCLLIGEWQYRIGGGVLQLTFYKLSLLALCARAGLDWYVRGSVRRPTQWLFGFIGVLLIFVLAQGALSSTVRTFSEVFGLGSYVMLGLCCRVLLRTKRDWVNLMTGLAVAVVCLGGLAAMQSGFRSLSMRYYRAKILGADPNEITTMALVWVLLSAPLMFMKTVSSLRRALAMSTIPTYFYLLFLSASRGATVSTVIGFGAIALLSPRRMRTRAVGVTALVLTGALVAVFAPDNYRLRMQETVQMSDNAERAVVNDAHRTELAMESLKLISERPFFGHGTGSSARRNIKVLGRGMDTHSMPLRLAESYGLFALAVLSALLLYAWRVIWRIMSSTPSETVRLGSAGVISALFAATVSSVGLTQIWPRPLWLCLAIISALHRNPLLEEDGQEPEPRDQKLAWLRLPESI